MNEPTSTNLNKFISQTGFCSRRGADALIDEGKVKINGVVAKLGNRVFEGDVVTINDKPLKTQDKIIYMAFNKPVGVSCTTDLKDKYNIIDFLKYPTRIFPIGRLDKPSQGLIFLTNDGDIVNKILRAGNNHEKEYLVSVDKPITAEFIKKMSAGVPILDTFTQKCQVTQESKMVFSIILKQGLNRQIRRMCVYLGYNVTKLKRTRIMNITLEGIVEGKWRYFTEEEINIINELVATSTKTEEGSFLPDDSNE